MAAVMQERPSTQWENLEPQGLGHDLLTEWAPWYREDREGGHSWHVQERVDRGYHGDPPERVHRVEKIVAKLKLTHHNYYRVIARYYLDQLLPHQIAPNLGITEGWCRSMLLAAGGLVEIRYKELAPQSTLR
jgi:hypothetical protein